MSSVSDPFEIPSAALATAARPTVSVVIATYNRGRVVRHAIESVRRSIFTNWEVIVVGDACTDDTAEGVATFADPRIRFDNLAVRCGDQSGPNNRGIELARGKYIAFLNHDDLFLPHHLSGCVAELEASGADLVWVPCALAIPKTGPSDNDRMCAFRLTGVAVDQTISPSVRYWASTWVFRRELAARIGPWLAADKSYVTPSQAWLYRVWRSGAAMRFLPVVSVIVVPAGFYPTPYKRRESPEHAWLLQWTRDDPRYREQLLEELAVSEGVQRLTDATPPVLQGLKRAFRRPVHAVFGALGIHPGSLSLAMFHGLRRGYQTRSHRKSSGSD